MPHPSDDLIQEQAPPVPNTSRPVWEVVIEDMRRRDQHGREVYGTPLQAGNGRKPLLDAYQEALDLVVYLRQEMLERELREEQLRRLLDDLGGIFAAAWPLIDTVNACAAGVPTSKDRIGAMVDALARARRSMLEICGR